MPDHSEPNQLVEHFFRHEYANLVSVLTRAFSFSRINMVEDMVSSAIVEAMDSWKQKGIPDSPAAWIHRVARNRILDSIRREKTHQKAMAFSGAIKDGKFSNHELLDRWLDESSLPDSLLRMMFVCCHPMLDRKSQIALTLKILCGFSVAEIARGLLMTEEAVKKRIQRAKAQLAQSNIAIEFPAPDQLQSRLSVVNDVLYLMFNEGYSTTHGVEPIRDEVCEEAARLCHMLCEHETLSTPASRALLSLMLFHASRLDARTDSLGNIVLLGDQDRTKWDRKLIDVADRWWIKSVDEMPCRFHFEALITRMHCKASSVEETDWPKIVQLYDMLVESYPSPIYRLNRAIAVAQSGDLERANDELESLRDGGELKDYFLLDCASAHIHSLAGKVGAAIDAYLAALSCCPADHQKSLIERQLTKLQEGT